MMKKLAVSLFTAMLFGSTAVMADLPDKEFVCKVQTHTLRIAVVFVQAWDMNSAREIAAVSPAVRIEDGREEQAQMVMECVLSPGGRFGDSAFQSFIENMPR